MGEHIGPEWKKMFLVFDWQADRGDVRTLQWPDNLTREQIMNFYRQIQAQGEEEGGRKSEP